MWQFAVAGWQVACGPTVWGLVLGKKPLDIAGGGAAGGAGAGVLSIFYVLMTKI